MPLHLDPSDGETPQRRVRAAAVTEDLRLTAHGVQALAHGSLVCPECSLPLVLGGRIAAGAPLRCGFCDTTGPARAFVRANVWDTPGNEVYLVARV
jgi:hypothetical protein